MARGPVTDSTILEHLAKHIQEHGDKGDDHQEQDERNATALNDCLETRRTRIVTVIAVAADAQRSDKAKDGGEDPRNDIGYDARQKLGKNRGAEQLAQVGLIGFPNLLERKRALHAADDRKVHHGGIAKHLKEDAQHKRDDQGKDEQAHRPDERTLESARTEVIIRTDGTDHNALDCRKHHADHRDNGDELEHVRNDGRENAQAKRGRTQQRTLHTVIVLERQIAAPLDAKAGAAHAGDIGKQKANGRCNTADNGDKQHQYRDDTDQRRQKGDLAHANQGAGNLKHVVESLRHTALGHIHSRLGRNERLRLGLGLNERLRLGLRLGLGLSLRGRGGSLRSLGIRGTANAAELVVVAHGGATLRTEHRNHPFVSRANHLDRKRCLGIIIAHCGDKCAQMTILQRRRCYSMIRSMRPS